MLGEIVALCFGSEAGGFLGLAGVVGYHLRSLSRDERLGVFAALTLPAKLPALPPGEAHGHYSREQEVCAEAAHQVKLAFTAHMAACS